MLRAEVGILTEWGAGQGKRRALAVEWGERPLVVGRGGLPVQRVRPLRLVGDLRRRRGGSLLAEWVCPCSVGGPARRDRRRGRSQWLEPWRGLPVIGTVGGQTG